MKYYKLDAVINNKEVEFKKAFATRNEAINFMFNYLNDNYIYNSELKEEYPLMDNKHNVQYVLNNNNRFKVVRCVL